MAKTSIPEIKIVNCETGEEIIRPLNEQELAEKEANDLLALERKKIAADAKAKAEADKSALLARLGLTEDELKTILG